MYKKQELKKVKI